MKKLCPYISIIIFIINFNLSATTNTAEEKEILENTQFTRSASTLDVNNMITSAIEYQAVHIINNKENLSQSSFLFGSVPITIWAGPIVFLVDFKAGDDNIKSEMDNYGGLMAIDIEINDLVNSRIGILGGYFIASSITDGVLSEVVNTMSGFSGGLYYNMNALNMRFSISSIYTAINNTVDQKFISSVGEVISILRSSSRYTSHSMNTTANFTYDLKLGSAFISPFVGISHHFYSQPILNALNIDGTLLFSIKDGSKNTLLVPIGISLSYTFSIDKKYAITPGIRTSANLVVFDTFFYAQWNIRDDALSRILESEIKVSEISSIIDANFNLSLELGPVAVYADYTLKLYKDNEMGHLINASLRYFF